MGAYAAHVQDQLTAARAEIARLTAERDEARDDALRLHKEKMDFVDAALTLVHSETIKNVCGWYSEIEAFRKLIGPTAYNVHEQLPAPRCPLCSGPPHNIGDCPD